jgi:hypothetical protein
MSKILQFSDYLLMYSKAKVAAQSDTLTTSPRLGWSGARRMSPGRLRDVGSRINCVRTVWVRISGSLFVGKNCVIVLNRSGKILLLGSAVPHHLVSRWTMSSAGAM